MKMKLQEGPSPTLSNLSRRDFGAIWHPYSRIYEDDRGHGDPFMPIPVIRGEGVWLYDDSGKRYLDAISSWWVNLHGHSHPYMAEKIAAQFKVLEHVIFAGFTHKPAIELAERLLAILPQGQSRIF